MSSNKNIQKDEDMSLQVGARKLHEGRQFMYDQVKTYHDSFLNKETGLFRDEFLETRTCPVCGSKNYRKMFAREGGIYVRCNDCTMCYLNPVFTDASLVKFYEGNNTVQSEVVSNESDFSRKIYSKGLRTIANYTKPGNILDIGCSTGFFLDLAKESAWKTTGVELNKKEAAVAIQKGHTVTNAAIETMKFPTPFHAITMWDVFEHIKRGDEVLQLIKRHLAKDGVLFMQIPSAEALAARMLQQNCKMFDGLEHVNLYAPQTIKKLANNNGFEILHIESVISEIPVMANYLDYQDPYLGDAEHKNAVLGLIDEKTLHENFLGYKLQIVMRPKA